VHIDDLGHLDVGARADFLVLPGEAFADGLSAAPAVSAELICDIRPLATVLDGLLVHEAPGFDPEG
jgi:cytosine/adenosine deaminase-related metal-dependent hydrolase